MLVEAVPDVISKVKESLPETGDCVSFSYNYFRFVIIILYLVWRKTFSRCVSTHFRILEVIYKLEKK